MLLHSPPLTGICYHYPDSLTMMMINDLLMLPSCHLNIYLRSRRPRSDR